MEIKGGGGERKKKRAGPIQVAGDSQIGILRKERRGGKELFDLPRDEVLSSGEQSEQLLTES